MRSPCYDAILPNAFLRNELSDDAGAQACGRCDTSWHPLQRRHRQTPHSKALAFIRRTPIRIEPRKVWAGHRFGRITPLVQEGRALCYLTDPGWGANC